MKSIVFYVKIIFEFKSYTSNVHLLVSLESNTLFAIAVLERNLKGLVKVKSNLQISVYLY